MKSASAIQSTTQSFLNIFDITNDLIILDDGAVALVLSVSAMNFGLLSEDEQDATIYAYAALLNSLSFPIQIVIRSQPKDVTKYLKLIEEKEAESNNPVYKKRIREYRTFVESLVQEQNVLDKKFYIVVPYSAVEMGLSNQSVIPGSKAKNLSSFEKSYILDKAKTNVHPRRDHIIDQLARIGLYSRQLNTQELIQMLYSSYNPESYEGQKVTDTEHYTTPLVQAQIQGDFTMTDQSLNQQATQPATTTTTPPASEPATAPGAPSSATPAPATPSESTPTPAPNATADMSAPSATPQFQQTPLGVTTPASMGQSSQPAGSAPAMPGESTPTPATSAPAPASATPAPTPSATPDTSGIQETGKITTPTAPVATAETTSSPAATTEASSTPASTPEEQAVINETLSALGKSPVDASSQNAGTVTQPTQS